MAAQAPKLLPALTSAPERGRQLSLTPAPAARWKIPLLVAATVLFAAYPALYTLLRSGIQGVFTFLMGDTFLYLSVAKYSQNGFFTYDGSTVTNGFHPLWQWIVTLLVGAVDDPSGHFHLTAVLLCSTALLSAGLVLTNLAIYRYTRSLFLSLLTIPGVYYLLVGSIVDNQSTWENLSGMESSLSVFFGGATLFVLARSLMSGDEPETTSELIDDPLRNVFVRLGLVFPLLILSRLDDVFVLASFAVVILLLGAPLRKRVMALVAMTAPTALTLLAYLAYNRLTAGTFMPLSGMSKGGLSFVSSVYIFLTSLCPPLLDLKNAMSTQESDGASFYYNSFRHLQMLVPAFIAVGYGLLVRAHFRDRARYVVPLGFAGYIVLKAAYNLINVNLWHQGPWYYAYSILLVSFLTSILLGDAYRLLNGKAWIRLALHTGYGFLLLLVAGRVALQKNHAQEGKEFAFWNDRDHIAQAVRSAAPNAKLIEFDDGIVNYALDLPVIHGFAFATDLQTYRANIRGELLRHAYMRGHDVLVSVTYMPLSAPLRSSDAIRDFLQRSILDDRVKEELHDLDFELIYLHERTSSPFIRFWPKPS